MSLARKSWDYSDAMLRLDATGNMSKHGLPASYGHLGALLGFTGMDIHRWWFTYPLGERERRILQLLAGPYVVVIHRLLLAKT